MPDMKISAVLQPLLRERGAAARELLAQLHPGQKLQASVLARLGRGQLRLLIGNTELLARSPLPLKPGTQLALQVEQGPPEVILKLALPEQQKPSLQTLARHAAARQQSPQQVREALRQPFPDKGVAAPLVRQAVELLTRPGIPLQRLDAAALRQALQQSGLYLERGLAAGSAPAPEDRKLQLLRLLRQLAPESRTDRAASREPAGGSPARPAAAAATLDRLMHLVEASIARIQHHQGNMLAGDDPNRTVWQLDLPVQIGNRRDDLQLRIEREQPEASADAADAAWKVDLHFDFAELGPVNARITLQAGRLSCAFRSRDAATARRFAEAIPLLETRLREAGLEPGSLASLQGEADSPTELPMAGLLDERA